MAAEDADPLRATSGTARRTRRHWPAMAGDYGIEFLGPPAGTMSRSTEAGMPAPAR